MASSSKTKFAVPPNTPVTIKWIGPCEDREHYITAQNQSTLDFGFNSSTLKAHLKIRVLGSLKGEAKKTWLYLYVRPEHIRTFDVTTTIDNTAPQINIDLTLYQPAFLVSPRELYPPAPKNAKAENIFAELKSLACARSFTICRSGASDDECAVFRAFAALLLRSGCGGIEAGAQEYRLERLYEGMGGAIVDVPAPDFFTYPEDDNDNCDDDNDNHDENDEEERAEEEDEVASNDDACEQDYDEERDTNAGEEDEDSED